MEEEAKERKKQERKARDKEASYQVRYFSSLEFRFAHSLHDFFNYSLAILTPIKMTMS